MKKKILAVILFSSVISEGSFAGAWNLSHHSRANCAGFNETVSWQAGHSYWFWINSRHRFNNGKIDHQAILDWVYTWRAANYHWPEGSSGGWTVEGHHWMKPSENGSPREIANEFVSDCSIYDGWWD
jgi:hypothetical protein